MDCILTAAGKEFPFPNWSLQSVRRRPEGFSPVFLRGISGSSQELKSLEGKWCADSHLILPDLRGHARSSVPLKPFRHQDAAEDILALLESPAD